MLTVFKIFSRIKIRPLWSSLGHSIKRWNQIVFYKGIVVKGKENVMNCMYCECSPVAFGRSWHIPNTKRFIAALIVNSGFLALISKLLYSLKACKYLYVNGKILVVLNIRWDHVKFPKPLALDRWPNNLQRNSCLNKLITLCCRLVNNFFDLC